MERHATVAHPYPQGRPRANIGHPVKSSARDRIAHAQSTAAEHAPSTWTKVVWIGLRLSLAWTFLWAFFDKTFGLGYATARENAWIRGGNPTYGFLNFGASGPFAGAFKAMADSAFIEWVFMLGLLFIGLALALGVGVRLAAYSGSLMMFLMWLAVLPKDNNPFMDDHIIYIFALLALAMARAGHIFGLGAVWSRTKIAQRFPWME